MQLTVVQLFVGLMVAVIASQEPQERDFMRWLRERGIKFNGLELANFAKHGRGVRTRRFVRQHETFLHVPANATISPIIARDHFRRIAPPGTDLAAKPCELSILFVMREALRVTTHGGRREPPSSISRVVGRTLSSAWSSRAGTRGHPARRGRGRSECPP